MEVFIIIGLILLNGILSMSEIAMVSARKPRLEADAKRAIRTFFSPRFRSESR